MTTTTNDLAAVVDALRGHDRFLATTHENPDGDALGSLLGMTLGLRQLGKDVVMVLGPQERIPAEYRFLPLSDLLREAPDDAGERVLICLDCASAPRSSSTSTTTTTTPASATST
jgi:phosphoesterase RecJ-like protein